MFEVHLPIANLCWLDGDLTAVLASGLEPGRVPRLAGRFAAAHTDGERITLVRDPLGLNKLFLGLHPDRGLLVANYLHTLVSAGLDLRRIYSAPAGGILTVDLRRMTTSTTRFHRWPDPAGLPHPHPQQLMDAIDKALTLAMRRVAASWPSTPVVICLSGGADSALIASYATRYLPHVTAYTYTFTGRRYPESQDAAAARAVAAHLGIALHVVAADEQTVLAAVPAALRHGQDWRDFNVHAAIVNEILAAAIAADHAGSSPVVLTGDLMNELLGDYSPVRYGTTDYYQLPTVDPGRLRIALTRGVQAGDREVGIFAAHGLQVLQPYAFAARPLLHWPEPVRKHDLMAGLAAGTLPTEAFTRPKVRAQIGDHQATEGILPTLIRH